MPDGELKAELTFGDHDGALKVLALRGSEELSRPFRYEVDFTAEALDSGVRAAGPGACED